MNTIKPMNYSKKSKTLSESKESKQSKYDRIEEEILIQSLLGGIKNYETYWAMRDFKEYIEEYDTYDW
jgi:hypothetical protein